MRSRRGADHSHRAGAGDAAANRYEATTTADHAPGKCTKRDCTLREAVIKANKHSGGDTVKLPASDKPYELTRAGAGEDEAKQGDLDLGDLLTVKGSGATKTTVVQRRNDRVFHVPDDTLFSAAIEKLTIKGGDAGPDVGGGVLTLGDLFLSDTKLTGNRASAGGGAGALGTDSRLSITDTTVTGNRATLRGGGLYLAGGDGVAYGVFRSLIEGNRGPTGGGGILFLPGDANLHVLASTITGNLSVGEPTSDGGGLSTESDFSGPGDAIVAMSTITANEAPAGAGANIHRETTVRLESTLIGAKLGGGSSCDASITSEGFNLDQGTSCGLNQASDIEDADPGLKPLADNGGATRTRALKGSSDALDEGTCPGSIIQLGVDQRGAGRPNACDIGAFERDPISPPD